MVNLGILEYDDLLQGQKKKGLKKEYFPETEDSPCDQFMVVSVVGYGAVVVNWRVKKNSKPYDGQKNKQTYYCLLECCIYKKYIFVASSIVILSVSIIPALCQYLSTTHLYTIVHCRW